VNVNNNFIPIQYARRLQSLWSVSPEFVTIPQVELLQQSPILTQMKGFFGSAYPLWKLGCLLDEIWLEEDVLNSLAELLYLNHHIRDVDRAHQFIYLPTKFFSDAYRLYHSTPRQFSLELMELRQRVSKTSVTKIGFLTIRDDHYVGYFAKLDPSTGSLSLEYGNSLHMPPMMDVLNIIRWIFEDIVPNISNTIQRGTISLQGNGNGGDGSCGIAAHNFIERQINSRARAWDGPSSQEFRLRALRDLCTYHCYAALMSNASTADTWLDKICTMSSPHWHHDPIPNPDPFCGYSDYNMFAPQVWDINSFENNIMSKDIHFLPRPITQSIISSGLNPIFIRVSSDLAVPQLNFMEVGKLHLSLSLDQR
jgi:hypothetical protein